MSFRQTVRVSKLQSKNRMVGKTFNPSGHTLQSLDKRDSDFLEEFNLMSDEDKQNRIEGFKPLIKLCKEKGWSFPFEYNLLERHNLLTIKELKGGNN